MSRAQLTSTVEQNTGGAVAPVIAGKNALANGAFEIWQRGTSFNTASAYTADRWQQYSNSAQSVSRQATSDSTNLPNIQYCARVQRNNGSSSTAALAFDQNLETVNSIPFAGKTITYSFYARAGANYSATSNVLNAQIVGGTGTDQNLITGYTGQVNIISSTLTLTTTWQRFSFTATVGTNYTQLAARTYYIPTGTASASDYYEITGVQLEAGSVATPFSRAAGTLQGELAACCRYFYFDSSNAGGGLCRQASTTQSYANYRIPTVMRVAPTITISNPTGAYIFSGGGGTSITGISGNGSSQAYYGLSLTHGSVGAAGYAADLSFGTATIQLNSEL